MITFPKISNADLLQKLDLNEGILDVVLDTDTYNEVDDQFALCYSLLSPERINVRAIYAAPFHNERSSGPGDGMEKSYNEITRLMSFFNLSADNFVYKGSKEFLTDIETPVKSSAAEDLARRAMEYTPENPLIVIGIAALTNIASAILLNPEIINRIVIIWLGGNDFHWAENREFNLRQDHYSARILFDCGVPVILIPCNTVAGQLITTVPELKYCIGGANELSDSLIALVEEYNDDHFGWSKVIWDIANIGYIINSSWVFSKIEHSPILTDQLTWSIDHQRHFIKKAFYINRDNIFRDMFTKLKNAKVIIGNR